MLILMRGKDMRIRAFHNACAHRGNTVVTETGEETFGGGKAAVVTCRFHGWVYGADGELKLVPQEAGFYDQSHLVNEFRALCGLTPGQFLQRSVSGSSKTGA